ncbi:MAG: MAPEG family protein [Alphaproteobacteria bacterium]|nr:MAG: MAPEG family protein [Alphaproteobacteria bacterium]
MLTSELSILAVYALVVALAWGVQSLAAMAGGGLGWMVSARDETRDCGRLHGRARRAADNSLAALAYFAPAVLALQLMDRGGGETLLAAQMFLAARVLYLPLYLAGVPWLRSLVWLVGFLACIFLYLAILL